MDAHDLYIETAVCAPAGASCTVTLPASDSDRRFDVGAADVAGGAHVGGADGMRMFLWSISEAVGPPLICQTYAKVQHRQLCTMRFKARRSLRSLLALCEELSASAQTPSRSFCQFRRRTQRRWHSRSMHRARRAPDRRSAWYSRRRCSPRSRASPARAATSRWSRWMPARACTAYRCHAPTGRRPRMPWPVWTSAARRSARWARRPRSQPPAAACASAARAAPSCAQRSSKRCIMT